MQRPRGERHADKTMCGASGSTLFFKLKSRIVEGGRAPTGLTKIRDRNPMLTPEKKQGRIPEEIDPPPSRDAN